MSARTETIVINLPLRLPVANRLAELVDAEWPGAELLGSRDGNLHIRIDPDTSPRTADQEDVAALTELNPGVVGFDLQGEPAQAFAQLARTLLGQAGAPNFVAIAAEDPDTGQRYEIVVGRADGKTTSETLGELRDELAAVTAERDALLAGKA